MYINFKFDCVVSDEYDHLDYSRPGSSFKPHYHRMNKMLNITQEESEIKENNLDGNRSNINNLNLLPSTSSSASSPDDNNSQNSNIHLKD